MAISMKLRLASVAIILVVVSSPLFIDPLPEPSPPPTNGFSFAASGGAPYGLLDGMQYPFVLQHMSDHDLQFVLHVGDILGSSCTDANYQTRLDWFNSLPHPVFYTPGDNEWTDCRGFDPYERLNRIREIFFAEPNRSLGGKQMRTTVQAKYYNSSSSPEAKYVENQFWTVGLVGFATLHIVGSANGTKLDNPEEASERLNMAIQWMADVFRIATEHNGDSLVFAFHANPGIDAYYDDEYRQVYQPFIDALIKHTKTFGKPVLIIQGDDHDFIVDHPLRDPENGQVLNNLTRLQVPGSPSVGWVKVDVIMEADKPTTFKFQDYVVPNWKYF